MTTLIHLLRAIAVRFSPTGNLTSTDVQSAIAEEDTRVTTLDIANVKTTGNQTIGGNKTFSGDLTANSYTAALTANTNVLNISQNAGGRTLQFGTNGLVNSSIGTFGSLTNGGFGMLEVNTTAARTGVWVKGAASQTSNLIEARNSANATLFSVSPAGAIAVSDTTNSTSSASGSITTLGGIGAAGDIRSGGLVTATNFSATAAAIAPLIRGNDGSGTNVSAPNLAIRPGFSTGNSLPAPILFSTSDPTTSGSTLQSATEKMRLSSAGNLLIGTTTDNSTDKLQVNGPTSIQSWRKQALTAVGLADLVNFVILLHPRYVATDLALNYCVGKFYLSRGQTLATSIISTLDINSQSAYRSNNANLDVNSASASGNPQFDLVTCTYQSIDWIAVRCSGLTSGYAAADFSFEGLHKVSAGSSFALNVVGYLNNSTTAVVNAEINSSIAAFTPNITKAIQANILQSGSGLTANFTDTANSRNIIITPGSGAIDSSNATLSFNRFAAQPVAVGASSDSRLRVGQGGLTLTALAQIDNTIAAASGLRITGASAQTANLFDVRNNAQTTIFSVSPTGAIAISDTTVSTSSASGSFVTAGGAGIGGALNVGGNTIITGSLLVGSSGISCGGQFAGGTFAGTLYRGYAASGTNAAGGNVEVRASASTGNAIPGSLVFTTSDPTISGSTIQTLTEKMRLAGSGNLLIGTTADNATDKLQVSGSAIITGVVKHTDTTPSTAFNNGCATFLGGIGVAGSSFFNSNVNLGSGAVLALTTSNASDLLTLNRGGVTFGLSLGGNNLVFKNATTNFLALITASTAATPTISVGTPDSTTITNATIRSSFIATPGSFTNQAGANLTLASGNGTGTGALPFIDFQTPDLQASGTGLQLYSSKARLTGLGNLLIGTTTDSNLANLEVVSSSTTKSAAVFRSVASHAAAIQEWRDSANTLVASVNVGTGGIGTLEVFASGTTRRAALFRGVTGQTAPVVEVRNNSNAITFNVSMAGISTASQYNLSALNTAPLSATDTGTTGERRHDGTYDYICIATNTWRRSAAYTTW